MVFLLSVSLFPGGLVSVSCPPHSSLPFCLSAGVGGNLVAVQASRISTFLHMNGMPGENSEQAPRRCPSPCTTFFSPGNGRVPASQSLPALEGAALSELPLRTSWGLDTQLLLLSGEQIPGRKTVLSWDATGAGDHGVESRDSPAVLERSVVSPD